MAWDWDYISGNFTEFTRFSAPTAGGLFAYPDLSKELLVRAKPDWIFRRYINKVADFTRGKGDYILFDRLTSAWKEVLEGQGSTPPLKDIQLAENDPVPNINIGVKRFSIKVYETAFAMPMTERVQLMARYDVKSIIDQYLRDLTVATIDAKIVWEAIGKIDLVAKKTSTGLTIIEGQAIKGGTVATESGFPISVGQLSIPAAETAGALTIQDVLTIKAEMIKRRMRQHAAAVICNVNFFLSIFQDTSFMQIVAFSRPERFEKGELGSVFGFVFIVDNSEFLDKLLTEIPGNVTSSGQKYNSIAVFLADDGIREAIALPEEVRTDVPLELGRFQRIGMVTYRGQSPLWFASDPDNVNPKQGAGFILIGK
jgi:hypothetical protein